ncbi:MAG: carbohydrate ABC transporter permease [Phototrophicaceae bacterium]
MSQALMNANQPLTRQERRARRREKRAQAIPYHQRVSGRTHLWILAFLAPFLLLYIGFTLWPLLATMIYSLYDWNGSTPLTDFVGLENYTELIRNDIFWSSFFNTLIFAVANTVIKLPLALGIAILLTRRWVWLKRIFRTVFFAPLVIPVAMAGLIFNFLLDPAFGAVNDALTTFNIVDKPITFLGLKYGMLSIVLISVWQILGQYMIYWMAALQNVPEELYEAAEIDGAGEWQKLIYITLPVIRPVAVIILFLSFVNALKVFGLVVAVNTPPAATRVVSAFIYNQALAETPFRYGFASAAAVLFGVTVLIAVTVQGYFVRRVSE